jgi:hypothetical protein
VQQFNEDEYSYIIASDECELAEVDVKDEENDDDDLAEMITNGLTEQEGDNVAHKMQKRSRKCAVFDRY